MGDGDKTNLKNFKIYEKDHKRVKDLSCAEYGMKHWEVFEVLLSFCLKHNDKLEKWHKKKKQEK